MDILKYYNDPNLESARTGAEQAATNLQDYGTAATLLPEKLREAVMNKVNYNKDIIEAQNKAQADYFAAPSAARAKYSDPGSADYIFNPFQAENLVSQERAQAYAPYASLTDILGQRMGRIEDIIGAGTGAFQAGLTGAQGAYDVARQRYQDLMDLAGIKTGLEWDQYKYLSDLGGSGGSSVASPLDLLGNLGLFDSSFFASEQTPYEEPPMTSAKEGVRVEYPQGSGIIWEGDGKGGWR